MSSRRDLPWKSLDTWTVGDGELERVQCASGHREILEWGDLPPYCFQCYPDRWLDDPPRTLNKRDAAKWTADRKARA